MTADDQAGDAPGYASAITELEQILAELEDDQIDVDHLAARVQRAAELIRLCRDRIGSAKSEVERIVAELDHLEDASPNDPPPDSSSSPP